MLYHKDTGFPFAMNLPAFLDLFYSAHAKRASADDRYGRIALPSRISTQGATVVELETCRNGNPYKIVLRKHHDDQHDVCFVIILEMTMGGKYFVKTVWLNEKTDSHRTLKREKYQQVSYPAAS